MVDNRGNAYRTRAAMSLGIAIIGIAIAMLAYFAAGIGLIAAIGIFVLVAGISVLAVSPWYSGAPDKFGPGERDYRIAMSMLMIIIGLVMIMTQLNLEWYWYVAVLIIAIAILGMAMALINSRKINNE